MFLSQFNFESHDFLTDLSHETFNKHLKLTETVFLMVSPEVDHQGAMKTLTSMA